MVEDDRTPIKILHVDDDPQFGDLVAKFLEREDDRITIVTESTVEAGLTQFQEHDFDCIVTDYDLPYQDGLTFLETVRDSHPDIPFILFTGKGSEGIAGEAISAGVTDYLQKQAGTNQYAILANRITNAVAQRRDHRRRKLSHQAMETASEGLSLVQPDGTFLYVNPAFAKLFGYTQDELIGEDWSVLYHNAEAKRLETDILPAVRETGHWAGETVRLTKQGDSLVTDHRLSYTDPDTDVIVCTAKDVTGERTAAADRHTHVDLLVETMDEYVFFTLDHEGYVTRWNEKATQVFGYKPQEILGTHLSVLFTEADRQAGIPEHLLDTAKTEGSITEKRRQLHKEGDQIEAELTLAANSDETGILRGFGTVIKTGTEPIPANS